MKRLWWILVLSPLFLYFQAKHGNFGGSWELDLKKSVNLPAAFKSVDSYVIAIVQKNDSMTVTATMKGNGQTVPLPPFVYLLNGKENYRKDSLRGSERWMTAHWGKDGKSVIMDTRVSMKQGDKTVVDFSQHDEWNMTGTTLDVSITQKMKGTDSVRTERRVFRKLK